MISKLKHKTKLLSCKKYFILFVITYTVFGLFYNFYYTDIFPIYNKITSNTSANSMWEIFPIQKSLPVVKDSLQPFNERKESWDSYEWEPIHPELEQNSSSVHNLTAGKINGSGSNSNYTINTPGCKIPAIRIFPPGFKRKVDSTPDCSRFRRLSTVNDEKQVLESEESVIVDTCFVQEIIRSKKNDKDAFVSPPEPLRHKHDVSKKELLVIRCGKEFNIEAHFPITPKVQKKIEYWKDKQNLPINVLFFGFDSSSRGDYHRSLPRTMKTAKEMGFIDFKGYHSVYPYTLNNFLGFLLGMTEPSVRKTCAPYWSSDSCPHIWKYYSENKFVTMYAEDGSQTFNWGGQGGFLKRPTDYYLHPMFRYLGVITKKYPQNTPGCLNHKLNVQNFLFEYQRRFAKKFENTPFFSFVWNNDATHEDRYKLAGMDNSFNKLLLAVNSSEQLLRRTMIIIVSDHGRRYGFVDYQDTFLERALPGLFVRLPEVLQEKYPNFINNLKTNTRKLTTGFDINHTLKHLLFLQNMSIANNDTDFKPTLSDRSSLFEPISENRTCSDVNIVEGNCACNTTGDIKAWQNPYLRHRLAIFAFAQLNGVLDASKYRNDCLRYSPPMLYQMTTRILRTTSNFTEGVLRFMTQDDIMFEVQLRVLHEDVKLENVKRISDFIRTTPYGNTSWCVKTEVDEDHMFKELCTCKEKSWIKW